MHNPVEAAARYRCVRRTYAIVGVIGAAFWLLRYASICKFRLWGPLKWSSWWDQSQYVRSAIAFANGNLAPSEHWYPLLYPLLGAPFAKLMPNNPFVIPDMFLFGLFCVAFVKVMTRLGIGTWTALACALLGDLLLKPLAKLWIVPWTTNLSTAAIWWMIALILDTLDEGHHPTDPRPAQLAIIAFIAALPPLARPLDLIISVVTLTLFVSLLALRRRLTMAGLGWMTVGGMLPIIAYGLLHLAIYGPVATEYMHVSVKHGFCLSDIGWKAYVILITSEPWFTDSPSIIEGMPWLVLGAAGIALTAWADRTTRLKIGLIVGIALPYCFVMLTYNDLLPAGVWQYNNAHYFKWLVPFLTVGAWIWVKSLFKREYVLPAIAALLLFLAPACLRLLPRPVGDDVPARMLLFPGSPDRERYPGHGVPAVITDSVGRLTNVQEYYQATDSHGQRAFALARLFGSHPVKDDPGEDSAHRTGVRPYARYADHLSVGLPCWVARAQCATGVDW